MFKVIEVSYLGGLLKSEKLEAQLNKAGKKGWVPIQANEKFVILAKINYFEKEEEEPKLKNTRVTGKELWEV